MSGFIRESGKRHRLVIPYVDENGMSHTPVFGVSSMSGKAIKEWAAQLYQMVINHKQVTDEPLSINQTTSDSVTDPFTVLKLRFARWNK